MNPITSAFLGPPGTYSEEALWLYGKDYTIKPVPAGSLEEICRGITEGQWAEGIIPVENSTRGSVGEAMDLLASYTDLRIRAEILLPVEHCLLANPGVSREKIETVVSHPQALGQCRAYIEETLAGIPLLHAVSTAHAAKEIAGGERPAAAIASAAAAKRYGLRVLARNINDCGKNVTRFLVLGREEVPRHSASKTTLIVSLKDRPGALNSVLSEFASRGINLTRIESRPAKRKLGEYIFLIDFVGHRDEPRVATALEGVRPRCISFRVAGSYPVAGSPALCADDKDSLGDLRRQIDIVDQGLMELLARRAALSEQIAGYKREGGVKDEKREKQILGRMVKQACKKGLNSSAVYAIFRIILNDSVRRQEAIVSRQFTASLCSRR